MTRNSLIQWDTNLCVYLLQKQQKNVNSGTLEINFIKSIDVENDLRGKLNFCRKGSILHTGCDVPGRGFLFFNIGGKCMEKVRHF